MSVSAFKLERFDLRAPAANTPSVASGESIALQRARAEAFAEGYAAGQAAAAPRAAEDGALLASLLGALETESKEAPQRAAADAASALKTLLGALLPVLSAQGFAIEAAEALTRAAKPRAGAVDIATSEEFAERLEARLREIAPEGAFAVRADPRLSGATACATAGGAGVEIDFEAATSACLAALDTSIQALKGKPE